jgi:hypothetical protein
MLKIYNAYFFNDADFIREDFQKDLVILKLNLRNTNLEKTKTFLNYLINITDKGITKVIIEIKNREADESTFIDTLIAALQRLKKIHCKIVMVYNNYELLESAFCVLGMQRVFKSFPNLNQAITYLNKN